MTKRKFTLIELIVVMAVIMILTTMLFKVMDVGYKKVRKAGCINNLRQMGAASAAYSGDNRGVLPASNVYGPNDECDTAGLAWKFQIANYVYPNSGVDYILEGTQGKSDSNIYECKAGFGQHEDLLSKTFECPDAPYYESSDGKTYEDIVWWRRGGYGINESLGEAGQYYNSKQGEMKNTKFPLHSAKLTIPSDTILIGDSLVQDAKLGEAHTLYDPTKSAMENRFYFVHDTGINILWCDGRVGWHDDIFFRNGPSSNTSASAKLQYYWKYKDK